MIEASISGVRAAEERMSASAHNVANLNTEEARALRVRLSERANRGGVDARTERTEERPDLAEETVEQMSARNYLKANANAIRTQDEMLGTLLDILA